LTDFSRGSEVEKVGIRRKSPSEAQREASREAMRRVWRDKRETMQAGQAKGAETQRQRARAKREAELKALRELPTGKLIRLCWAAIRQGAYAKVKGTEWQPLQYRRVSNGWRAPGFVVLVVYRKAKAWARLLT